MAQRRMFSNKIVDTDAFLDMPLSSQALYFHLSMRADDDGFIGGHKKIMRMIGCSDDDMRILLAKNFIIPFESGVCVIKHWKIHNYIQTDRYNETTYIEEKSQLDIKKNKSYTLKDKTVPQIPLSQDQNEQVDTKCIQNVYTGKVSIGKISLDKTKDIVGQPDHIPYKEILDYLNTKAEKNYKSSTKAHCTFIKARWNEGHRLEQFKLVIDVKTKEWLNTEQDKFLRPATLFGTKFEGYLYQKEIKDKPKSMKDNQTSLENNYGATRI